MIEYFSERSGIQCPREDNPAEYMLDVIAGPTKDGADWHETFLRSELQSTLVEDLSRIKAHANTPADPLKGYGKHSEYSASFFIQFNELARRTARHYWRSAD